MKTSVLLWNLKWSLCCLLDPLTNKHCRARSSMVDLWIDSRTSQNCRILLSARQKSNNYLELPSYSGEYDAVILTMLYLKVLHDLVPQNSSINFLEAATIEIEIEIYVETYVLNIEQNHLFLQLYWKFYYKFRTMIL